MRYQPTMKVSRWPEAICLACVATTVVLWVLSSYNPFAVASIVWCLLCTARTFRSQAIRRQLRRDNPQAFGGGA